MVMFMVCGVTIMSTCVVMFHTKLFTAKQCDMMMAMLSQYTNVSHVRFTTKHDIIRCAWLHFLMLINVLNFQLKHSNNENLT